MAVSIGAQGERGDRGGPTGDRGGPTCHSWNLSLCSSNFGEATAAICKNMIAVFVITIPRLQGAQAQRSLRVTSVSSATCLL